MNNGDDIQNPFAQQVLPVGIPDLLTQASTSLDAQSARGGRIRVSSHHSPPAVDNRALVQVGGQRAPYPGDRPEGGVELFDDIISGIGGERHANAHPSEPTVSEQSGTTDPSDLLRLLR